MLWSWICEIGVWNAGGRCKCDIKCCSSRLDNDKSNEAFFHLNVYVLATFCMPICSLQLRKVFISVVKFFFFLIFHRDAQDIHLLILEEHTAGIHKTIYNFMLLHLFSMQTAWWCIYISWLLYLGSSNNLLCGASPRCERCKREVLCGLQWGHTKL